MVSFIKDTYLIKYLNWSVDDPQGAFLGIVL